MNKGVINEIDQIIYSGGNYRNTHGGEVEWIIENHLRYIIHININK